MKQKLFIIFLLIALSFSGCAPNQATDSSQGRESNKVIEVPSVSKEEDESSSEANKEIAPSTVPETNEEGSPSSEIPDSKKESVPPSPVPDTDKSSDPSSTAPEADENTVVVPEASSPKEIDGFVLLSSLDKDLVIDLKYATPDNFTGQVVYPTAIAVLRTGTAEKLAAANKELMSLGYRIKVWDAYRPVSVQIIFWNLVQDSKYVANPYKGGSIHNKGSAVDITLVDSSGNEVEMPSAFDDFSERASRNNPNMSNAARENMRLLTDIMVKSGFTYIDSEWWHFNDSDAKKYDIADIDLSLFLK